MAKPLFLLFKVIFLAGCVCGSDWRYEEEGKWAPLCQSGKRQSPIALSESVARLKEFHQIILQGYGQVVTALLKNNGHSAEIRLQNVDPPPTMHGAELPGTFKLDHLHFHWQSEHTINSYRYPLELHLVHYHQKYKNLTQAAQHSHGVAVLGVMFSLSPDDDDEVQPLVEIIDNLKEKVGEPRQLDEFNVKNFIPRDRAGFYRYQGSLTTPGCNEGIIWTVFTSTLPISIQQVKIFEEIQTHEKTTLHKNFRSLQPLNDRKVYLKVSPIRDSSATTQPMSVTLTMGLLISCFVYSRVF